MKRIKNNRGMTLMETLSAAMIFVVIFMLTYGVFDSGNRLWSVTDASANNQLNVRQALMDMERAIRGGTNIRILQSKSGGRFGAIVKSELRFVLNGSNYHYYVAKAKSTDTLYQLHETTGSGVLAEDKIIANNIVSCIFNLEQPADEKKKVLITITARKTTSTNDAIDFTLKQMVTLRNADGSICQEVVDLTRGDGVL